MAEDLAAVGRLDLADYFSTSLEPEDVEELLDSLRTLLPSLAPDTDVRDRLEALRNDLGRLVEAGAGLTDRYSDDLD